MSRELPVIASDRRERGNLIQWRYTLGLPQRFALRNDRLSRLVPPSPPLLVIPAKLVPAEAGSRNPEEKGDRLVNLPVPFSLVFLTISASVYILFICWTGGYHGN